MISKKSADFIKVMKISLRVVELGIAILMVTHGLVMETFTFVKRSISRKDILSSRRGGRDGRREEMPTLQAARNSELYKREWLLRP